MSSIQDVLQRRGIKSLIPFTRLENLDSILMHGIVPRGYLFEDDVKVWEAREAMFSSDNLSKDPFDVQAEVVISDVVELKYIHAVFFNDKKKM